MKKKYDNSAYVVLLPTFILFGIFIFYPLMKTFMNSFSQVNMFGEAVNFVGIANYKKILTDPEFLTSIKNSLYYALLTVPTSKIIGLILALLARKRRKFSTFYEVSFALPMVVASSVIAMIFQLLFVPSLGFINNFFGLDVQWLRDPAIAMLAVGIIGTWLATGNAFIFLLAAVRNIPEEIIESADIEGAGAFRKAVSIYLPLVSPTMFYLLMMDIPSSLMQMSLTNILTQGGPENSTLTIMQYIYRQFSGMGNYTVANPAAIMAFILMLMFMMLGFKLEKRGVHY